MASHAWEARTASGPDSAAVLQYAPDDARQALDEALEALAHLPPPNETPDPAKPPYELLGDILLEAGIAEEAIVAYRRQLDLRWGRARSLIGLARAAGRIDVARDAYQRLLDQRVEADEDRPELEEARAFLGGDDR